MGLFSFIHSFILIRSFILETYIAPLQDTTTRRRPEPSHGQRRNISWHKRCFTNVLDFHDICTYFI